MSFIASALCAVPAAQAQVSGYNPVIMIPGMGGTTSNMTTMQNNLQQNGWPSNRLFTWTDADQMNKDMEVSAAAIKTKVDQVLAQTGASKVVLATWSASTIAGRYYIKNLGGDQKVSHYISFAGPHHGISIWNQCTSTQTACRNQWGPIPNTTWLKNLNSPTEVPGWPNVRYLSIRGSADQNATPVDTAILAGADENFLVNGATHFTIINDTTALAKMREFIKRPFEPVFSVKTCTASVSGNTATINATAESPAPIVSYRVRLTGPTGYDDVASVSGTSFSKAYPVADGTYSGTVTATDNAGKTTEACVIPGFSVGVAPPQAEHDPVIVMTGASGDLSKSAPMKDYLLANGWKTSRMFHWKDSSGFQGDVPTTAREISAKVDDVLRTTGASKVVLITWSSSTVSSRYYVKNLGGAQKVSQFVSIAGPHHGITNYVACQSLWVSCSQWGPIPLTQFMKDLNSGTEVPGSPAVKYLTMRGTSDTNASPVDTAILAGADENALFQGLDHYTLITNAASQAKVRDFLLAHEDGGTPPPAGAPTGLGVTSFTSSSVSLSWSGVTGASGYNVYRGSSASGPWTRVNTSLVGGTTFNATGLTAGTTYFFAVRAQKSDGTESANSNVVSQSTSGTGGTTPSATAAGTANAHYVAGRVSYSGYLTLGSRYGYIASFTLYKCGTTWTDKANCAAL